MLLRFDLTLILWVTLSPAFAQVQTYNGPAHWLPCTGAQEQYSYLKTDSLKQPQGAYSWKRSRELNAQGNYELLAVQANFDRGVAEGITEILHYNLTFSIEDFDKLGVHAATVGFKTLIKGQYSAGIPTGIWYFEYSPLHESQNPEILTLNLRNGQLQFSSDSLQFVGSLNKAGIFDGQWRWMLPGADTLRLQYSMGILSETGGAVSADIDSLLKQALRSFDQRDSLAPAPANAPWVWNPGCSAQNPLLRLQEPVAKGMVQALQPHTRSMEYLSQHPLLELPPIVGTTRFYHELPQENHTLLAKADAKIQSQAYSLYYKLETPAFLLRRAGSAEVDSLMLEAEALLLEGMELQAAIIVFQGDEARFLSPRYLDYPATATLQSHSEYAQVLLQQSAELGERSEHMLEVLDEHVEMLRLRGNLEELESEWYLLQQAMSEWLCNQTEPSSFVRRLYSRFVESDHEHRTRAYGAIQPLADRQSFLQDALEYNQYFHDFFLQEEYRQMLDLDAYLLNEYTQYLYNPYMAIDNIEVVVKAKFLNRVLNDFLPYLQQSLETAPDGHAFRQRYEEVLLLRDILTNLAHDNSQPARKLSRKARKLNSMKAMEAMLTEWGT